ncbi:MAG TPA: Nramp family divalent metal transporter [Bacteroidales bacterium]|nr:Nramp family divalent metal transporter [Bacteroidales bacterium]HPE56991.1 Nramp family divalent metal transporter [Bacteroidales bacterium]HRX95654.1 Nramp family divalent metal transporter [Bacteroidales bacterium]
MTIKGFLRILGPGLLYAGAAVGVSHLVQSTRAGANYGFELLWILIFANAIKYPFFQFGPRYAAVTGENLMQGYRKIGNWAVIMFAILTIGSMFAVQAAVTIVTAGLVGNVFGLGLNPVAISAIILLITMIALMIGRYAVLDKIIKLVIVLLAISTITAVILAMGRGYNPNPEHLRNFRWGFSPDIFFLIAFIGWMPAPIDITVWHSLWTNAKFKLTGEKPRLRDVLLDFNFGYIGTAFLAVCFLALGAFILYGSGDELSPKGGVFAGQLIKMYTDSIGSWAYVLIAIAAITTMFSTTMTCLDAFPRVMKPLRLILFPKMSSFSSKLDIESWIWLFITASGALIIMWKLADTMQTMVNIATTLSFVTAPLLAILNYKVVTGKHMPPEGRPQQWLRIYSWIGIVFLSGFTLFYIVYSLTQK